MNCRCARRDTLAAASAPTDAAVCLCLWWRKIRLGACQSGSDILGMLMLKLSVFSATTLLLFQLSNWSLAEEASRGSDEDAENLPYWRDADIAFQWNYSCPARTACSFTCPGAGGVGTATDVIKLDIYLGTLPVSSETSETALAIFFKFATRSIPHGNGFGVGMSIASCQIKGMRLDYIGQPK
jgi:hypothetical protein